ncbi:hypothetical protein FKM82_013683 [Ascaphus truei]
MSSFSEKLHKCYLLESNMQCVTICMQGTYSSFLMQTTNYQPLFAQMHNLYRQHNLYTLILPFRYATGSVESNFFPFLALLTSPTDTIPPLNSQ